MGHVNLELGIVEQAPTAATACLHHLCDKVATWASPSRVWGAVPKKGSRVHGPKNKKVPGPGANGPRAQEFQPYKGAGRRGKGPRAGPYKRGRVSQPIDPLGRARTVQKGIQTDEPWSNRACAQTGSAQTTSPGPIGLVPQQAQPKQAQAQTGPSPNKPK